MNDGVDEPSRGAEGCEWRRRPQVVGAFRFLGDGETLAMLAGLVVALGRGRVVLRSGFVRRSMGVASRPLGRLDGGGGLLLRTGRRPRGDAAASAENLRHQHERGSESAGKLARRGKHE